MTSIESLVDRMLLQRRLLEHEGPQPADAVPGQAPAGSLRVITVSRETGSGGHTLAQRVAADLGFEFVDRQILDLLVAHTGAREKLLASLDERKRSAIDLWVEGLVSGRYIDRGEYRRWLARAVTALAEAGGAVILGRGANIILRERGGLHVRVVAPPEVRIQNLCTFLGMARAQAERRVARADEERRQFLRQAFGTEIDLASGYHLVINTGLVPLEAAREMILLAWRRSMGEA